MNRTTTRKRSKIRQRRNTLSGGRLKKRAVSQSNNHIGGHTFTTSLNELRAQRNQYKNAIDYARKKKYAIEDMIDKRVDLRTNENIAENINSLSDMRVKNPVGYLMAALDKSIRNNSRSYNALEQKIKNAEKKIKGKFWQRRYWSKSAREEYENKKLEQERLKQEQERKEREEAAAAMRNREQKKKENLNWQKLREEVAADRAAASERRKQREQRWIEKDEARERRKLLKAAAAAEKAAAMNATNATTNT